MGIGEGFASSAFGITVASILVGLIALAASLVKSNTELIKVRVFTIVLLVIGGLLTIYLYGVAVPRSIQSGFDTISTSGPAIGMIGLVYLILGHVRPTMKLRTAFLFLLLFSTLVGVLIYTYNVIFTPSTF